MQNCLCVHPLISLFRVRLLATHASLALRLWYSSTGVWSSLKIHCFSDLSKHTLLPIPFSWHVSSWNRSRVHRVLRKTLILESLSFSDVICPDKWSSLHTMLLLLRWIFFSVCMLGQTFKHRTLLQLALANAGVLGTEQAHHWNLTQRPLHSRYKSQLWWNKRDVSREQPGKCDHLHCKRGEKKKKPSNFFWLCCCAYPLLLVFLGELKEVMWWTPGIRR